MFGSEVAAKLAEIKRLSNLAAGIAPARKSNRPNLTDKEVEMVQELMRRLTSMANEVIEWASQPPEIGGFTPIDEDVLAALLNLGCARPAAEAAIRRAKVRCGGREFEPLFRQALEFVR